MTLHLELLTILSMLFRNIVRIAPRTSTCPTITRDFTQLHPSQVKISILIMLGIVSNSYSFIPISDKRYNNCSETQMQHHPRFWTDK